MSIQTSGDHPAGGVPAGPPPAPVVVDPEEFARLAAEVVALMEHHRAELRAAMDELTALQRTVRAEVRDAVAVLRAASADATADLVDR